MSLETQARQLKQDIDEVYEAGKQAEYDRFWNAFQTNGKRTAYPMAFAYDCWNNTSFKPKYQLKPVNANQMFYRNQSLSGEVQELINIDFSSCTNLSQTFQDLNKVTRLGVIDARKVTTATNTFTNMSNLVTIDKIIFAETTPAFSFANDAKLKNVNFEGVIAKSHSFSSCPLSVESVKSLISCLKNYSGTTSEYTLTLSSESKTALEAEGATSPNGNTWSQYIDDLGWTLK